MCRSPFRVPRWALLLLVAVLSACGSGAATEADRRLVLDGMIEEVRTAFPDVPTATPADVAQWLAADDVVLVDVRSDEERAVSTLPGALTADDFEGRLEELAGRRVVAYCTIGRRSAEYAERMSELGVEVHNLEGSILAWTHDGGTLVADGQVTRELHVFGRRWDLAADGYRTTW